MWKRILLGAVTLLLLASLLIPLARDHSPFSLGLDLAGGAMVTYRADLESVPERFADLPERELLALAKDAMAGRLAQRFETLPDVVIRDDGRLVVSLPGEHDQRRVLETLGQTYRLGFRLAVEVHESRPSSEPGQERALLLPYEGRWLELGPELLDGGMLDPRSIRVQAESSLEDLGRGAAITFEFRPPHDETFARLTRESVGETLAILLDEEVEWAGRVESEIRGPGLLRGGYTVQQAAEVAGLLRAGQLPFSLELESLSSVGPTLGQEMAKSGLRALAWSASGLALLVLLAYGHRPALLLTGLASLGFLLLTTLGLIAGLQLTVDLVAIAGLVLSIGMGMDAFILVFEALESGRHDRGSRSPLGRLRAAYGWSGEGRTLLHANATTLLVVLLLFLPDRLASFALFLCVGLLASLTTLVLTHRLLSFFARRGWLENAARRPSLLDRLRRSRPDIFRWRRVYLALLALALAATATAVVTGTALLELGADFEPGLQLRVTFDGEGPSEGTIEACMADLRATYPGLAARHQTWHPPGAEEGDRPGYLITTADPGWSSGDGRSGDEQSGDAASPRELAALLEEHGASIHGMDSIDARLSAERMLSSLGVFLGSSLLLGFYLRFAQPRLDAALADMRSDSTDAASRRGRIFAGTVLAVVLDVLVVLGTLALVGIPLGLPALAALLTIVGYSVNDSMVLWSHLSSGGDTSAGEVSRGVDRLLSRTLLTSASTMVPAVAMLVAGLEPLRGFAWAVLAGTVSGTLSSIFIVASFAVDDR